MKKSTNLLTVTFFVLLYSLITITCLPQNIDIGKIIAIESSGNKDAWNHLTDARGLCQLREIAWKDVIAHNPSFAKYYWDEHSFDPIINVMFAEEYFRIIEGYLKHYNLPLTDLYRIASFNFGIGNVVRWHKAGADFDLLPRETRNYYNLYKK